VIVVAIGMYMLAVDDCGIRRGRAGSTRTMVAAGGASAMGVMPSSPPPQAANKTIANEIK
jgi:hypothetical protein